MQVVMDYWNSHIGLRALVIFSVSVLISVFVRFVLARAAKRLAGKTKTDLDDYVISTFQNPIAISIWIGGFWHAIKTLAKQESGFFAGWAAPALHASLVTLVILVWMIAFLRFSTFFVNWLSYRENMRIVEDRTKPLFQIIFKILVLAVGGYLVIVIWDQDITGWLASAGIAGIAIGFAARDTLANLFAGIFIIADAPYKIGDYIVLDNGDRGRVTDIGLRSTRLLTRDDVEVIIPNGIIGNSTVINQSGGPYEKFRLRVPVSVAYGSDIDLVRDTLMAVAGEEDLVQKEPAARVRFREFADSGLNFEVLVWVETPELRGLALDRLLTAIYKRFAARRIEIPYPKRDVYLHRVKAASKEPDETV